MEYCHCKQCSCSVLFYYSSVRGFLKQVGVSDVHLVKLTHTECRVLVYASHRVSIVTILNTT